MVLIRAGPWLANSTPSVGTKTTRFCEALELSRKISIRRGVTRWNSRRAYDSRGNAENAENADIAVSAENGKRRGPTCRPKPWRRRNANRFPISTAGRYLMYFSEAGNSASGSTSNIRMIPIQANMRNAASWPFQIFDCHIKNHSPPTDKKATNHCKRLRVRPMIAGFLACWKLDEADFRLRRPLKAPHQQRTAVAVSHTMIVA